MRVFGPAILLLASSLLLSRPLVAASTTRDVAVPSTTGAASPSGFSQPGRESRPSPKSARKAALLSLIFPGVGHLYLGDEKTGTGLLTLGAIELGAMGITLFDGWPDQNRQGSSGLGGNIDDPAFLLTSIWFQNTWTWGIFSAWRDARLLGEPGPVPLPRESIGDLALAPVNPGAALEAEVVLGLVGWVGAATLLSHWLDDDGLTGGSRSLFEPRKVRFMGKNFSRAAGIPLGEAYYSALFFPVGIGEEAFFRGYLQTSLTESLGPVAGWAVATLVFGLAHAPNALLLDDRDERIDYLTGSLPFITLVGGYLGWMYQHNQHSLSEVVAFHFWYDVLLGTVAFLTRPDEQPFSVGVGVPL